MSSFDQFNQKSTWEAECRWQTIRAQQAIDEAKALRARVAELEAVLLPFAEAADECDEYRWDDNNQAPVYAGQCREARAALQLPSESKKGQNDGT